MTHVFKGSHIVLPEEIGSTDIPCGIRISVGVITLQHVVAFAVITATRDSLIDEIPTLYLAATGFHHTLNPFIHCINKNIVTFLWCQRYRAWEIDICNTIANSRFDNAATIFFDPERTNISTLEVAIIDFLYTINLQTDVVKVIVILVSQFTEIKSYALTCSVKLTADCNRFPIGSERDIAKCITAHPCTWSAVYLGRGVGRFVGTHVGCEHIACILSERTWHYPKLVVP